MRAVRSSTCLASDANSGVYVAFRFVRCSFAASLSCFERPCSCSSKDWSMPARMSTFASFNRSSNLRLRERSLTSNAASAYPWLGFEALSAALGKMMLQNESSPALKQSKKCAVCHWLLYCALLPRYTTHCSYTPWHSVNRHSETRFARVRKD